MGGSKGFFYLGAAVFAGCVRARARGGAGGAWSVLLRVVCCALHGAHSTDSEREYVHYVNIDALPSHGGA